MRTATIHRSSDPPKRAIRSDDPASSDSTTTGGSPVTSRRISAYARAAVWSDAMTSPPASAMPPLRCPVSRRSAAARTAGIHSPPASRAVRQARAVCSAVSGSPSRAVNSSPALVRQLDVPE